MNLAEVLLLLAAGLTAGTVNAIAGGGSLITFPALIATGLPPVAANVTNSVSVFPGSAASVFGSRTDLRDAADGEGRGRLLALVPTAVVGSVLGCVLLLATPSRAFELVVPFLVLAAGVVLGFGERLRRLVGHPAGLSPRRRAVTTHLIVGLGTVYGGYFGAALGVILVAAFALVFEQTLARISAMKNAVAAIEGLVTVFVFTAFGPVAWSEVLVLIPATMTGGYLGARLARRLPARLLRAVIVSFATVVGLVLLYRALT